MSMAFLTLVLAGTLGDDLPPLAIGATIPTWTQLPGADGKKHSLSDLRDAKALLVVFYENECPDCGTYTDRVIALARDYQSKGVATVLLNVSKREENGLKAMAERAKETKMPCQYLLDFSQKIGKAFGATTTPTAYVFGEDRKLLFRGAIDDNWKPAKVKNAWVRLALDAALAGKTPATSTTDVDGCHIEYED